jgi:hypothetical protein
MTGKFSNQGTLSTSGTILHTAPENNISELYSMRFNNPVAYTLTVSKHTAATSSTTQVYSINLSAGDTVTDTFKYHLDEGDYITATSSVAGTTFIIEGSDLPNVNVIRCK